MRQVAVSSLSASRVAIALDAPATANALSPALVADLRGALEDAWAARVVTIGSTGRVFCAGLDLAVPVEDDAGVAERFAAIQGVLELLRRAPFVTVACVAGAAYGAGADLAVACDYRLATPGARLRFPGSRFGVVLGLERLVEVLGADAARDVVLRDRVLGADEALALGLATHRVDEFEPLVAELEAAASELDDDTLAALLQTTRGLSRPGDAALLLRSTARSGLAARLRAYAARRA